MRLEESNIHEKRQCSFALAYLVIIKDGNQVSGLGLGTPGVDLTQHPVQGGPLAEVSGCSHHIRSWHVQNAVHCQLTHQLHLGWVPAPASMG